MELYLQVGAKMMGLCRDLFQDWGGGTAILSPRDLDPDQMARLSRSLRQNGTILLDPQFYLPRADYQRLVSHDYWPDDYDTVGFADGSRQTMIQKLVELNRRLGTTALIVPGERAEIVNNPWLDSQRGYLETARNVTDQPLIATICLSAEAIRSQEQISLVMEQAEQLPALGYYLVLERPDRTYLTDDPLWLAHSLDLAAGLRRLGRTVIVGYSNQQQLIMACAAVNAIASGTYLNVRTFSVRKFNRSYGEGFRRRAVWYYCPQTFSEYKLQFLDFGVERGFRDALYPETPSPYTAPLFATDQPTASGWREPDSFRHYLTAVRTQARSLTRGTFDETVAAYRALLDRAENVSNQLRGEGIFGQDRDFRAVLDANRAALIFLEDTQGPVLRRSW